jgi:hypothetical protein
LAGVEWRRDRAASGNGEDRLNQIAAPIVTGFLYGCVVLYGILSLILFLTARKLVQSPSNVYAAGRGRGCRMYYGFYDDPIGRRVSVWHDKLLWNVQSGEPVTVVQRIGPLGARIESIERRLH